MSKKVEFEDKRTFGYRDRQKAATPSRLEKLAMKAPYVSTVREARWLMIGFIVLALTFSIAIYNFQSIVGSVSSDPTYVEDLSQEERSDLPPDVIDSLPSKDNL